VLFKDRIFIADMRKENPGPFEGGAECSALTAGRAGMVNFVKEVGGVCVMKIIGGGSAGPRDEGD